MTATKKEKNTTITRRAQKAVVKYLVNENVYLESGKNGETRNCGGEMKWWCTWRSKKKTLFFVTSSKKDRVFGKKNFILKFQVFLKQNKK